MSHHDLNPSPKVELHRLEGDGTIPNNPDRPLIIYRRVFDHVDDPAASFEDLFARNGWTNGWRDGIYGHHHYHTNTHEVLGIAAGHARVRFGGDRNGIETEVHAGDLVVVPAGVAHRNLGASAAFLVVGAYPDGREPDMHRDDPPADTDTAARIRSVPLPDMDPLYGADGPLITAWRKG